MMIRRMAYAASLPALSIALVACADDPNAPAEETVLLSVIPEGGATNVDTETPIELAFDHAMGNAIYAALHEGGDVAGPLVDGTWSWSPDSARVTFTPVSPLSPQTRYTIHVGGGMTDLDGHMIDFEQHGYDMGGEWVTQGMMDQRMMNGTMMGEDDMMGEGWQHANGSYGMVFSFTTG
jgi:hypothetical protein